MKQLYKSSNGNIPSVYLGELSLSLLHLFSHVSLVCHVAGISGQYPLVQNMTVTEGGTANLTCRVEYNDNTSLQWSNPAQQTLFFGDKKGELEIDSSSRSTATQQIQPYNDFIVLGLLWFRFFFF